MSKKKVSPETEAEEEAVVAAEEAEVDMGRLLEEAKAKADENWDKLLRLQAEMENSQRRAQRELENAHKYGLEKFAQELLPVKDSLELGLAAVDENEHEAFLKLREGTELTLKMLSSALEKFGIKEVDPQGQPFSAEQHQAMAMQESAEHEANTVMAVMQKGYLINDRLLRPAMVIVSKGPAAEAVDEQG